MPLLRGRRHDENTTRYQMREKLFSIGDDYWIETGGGRARVQGERKGAAGPRHAGAGGALR